MIATTNTDTTQLIVARVNGTDANSIATTQAGTSHCTWAGATMNSGTPGTGPAAVAAALAGGTRSAIVSARSPTDW